MLQTFFKINFTLKLNKILLDMQFKVEKLHEVGRKEGRKDFYFPIANSQLSKAVLCFGSPTGKHNRSGMSIY